jgi:hypothetical protein
MKKVYKILIIIISSLFIVDCSTEDKSIDEVRDNTSKGAVLKTIEEESTFNFFDPSSSWSITVEEQDVQKGGLFSKVNLYSEFTANVNNTPEKFIKSIPSSSFSSGPFGFPRGKVSVTLSEVLAVLNVAPGSYTTDDTFTMRLELELTDGRKFSSKNSGGTVVGGSFFNSPFIYSAPFFCPYSDASKYNGNFKVVKDTRKNYTIGDIVPLVYDVANGKLVFRILNSNNPKLVNKSSFYEVTIKQADNSVTVKSSEDLDFGGGPLIKVTGTGSVGSCSGDINLVLTFSDSPRQEEFNLVKE